MTYQEWIDAFLAKLPQINGRPYVRGACMRATAEMAATFPELRRVAGFANGGEHFWCVAPDGTIVDPTVGQFFSHLEPIDPSAIEYREFRPGDEVRVGKCMNCGADIYAAVERLDGDDRVRRRSACSDECETALIKAFE
jgi:hypothetical protein